MKKDKMGLILIIILVINIFMFAILLGNLYNDIFADKGIKTENNQVEQVKEKPEIETFGYNLTKDNWINDVLNGVPESVKVEPAITMYRVTLKYKEVKFIVYLYFQTNDCNIYAYDNNDEHILLESDRNIPEHQIHPKTLERIKQICIKYERNEKN